MTSSRTAQERERERELSMGRPKRKRRQSDSSAPDPTVNNGDEVQSSDGKTKSKSRRKRARLKSKKLKKAKQKKQEKRERERATKYDNDEDGSCLEAVLFTVNHTWLNGKSPTRPRAKAGPRDCYDECLSILRSARGDKESNVIFSWLNELSWFDTSTEIVSEPLPQKELIDALLQQLGDIKNRLWPAAVRCAAAHNASNFDQQTPENQFSKARRACNPFECLGEGQQGGLNTMFVNRAAIKLANMNAILDFSLIQVHSTVASDDPFVFVDLCGAPGGFSEYIMYTCKSRGMSCRGYGMSLIGENGHGNGLGWKLDHIAAIDGETSTNFRVCGGADGTGDIYKWENIASLCDTVAVDLGRHGQDGDASEKNADLNTAGTCSRIRPGLADLVVADGGFDAQRDSSCQENLAQRIVICQAAAALELLRSGGKFVMKMFGYQTEKVRRLVNSLSQCFESLAVLKPVSSRPASAERYLVCISYSGVDLSWDGRTWIDSLFSPSAEQCSGERFNDCQQVEEGYNSSLGVYLDTVDADIARLNIKSCSSILSYLQNKAELVETGGDGVGKGAGTSKKTQYPAIDTHLYKSALQLG